MNSPQICQSFYVQLKIFVHGFNLSFSFVGVLVFRLQGKFVEVLIHLTKVAVPIGKMYFVLQYSQSKFCVLIRGYTSDIKPNCITDEKKTTTNQ